MTSKSKLNRPINWIIVTATLVIIFAAGIFFWVQSNAKTNVVQNPASNTNQSSNNSTTDLQVLSPKVETKVTADLAGLEITKQLKQANSAYDMGFISSTRLKERGIPLPVKIDIETALVDKSKLDPSEGKPLEDLIPKPQNSVNKNLLVFPKYNITAPIQYSTFSDVFGSNKDGTINFAADPGQTNYNDETPVQKKLKAGIVHLAFSPMPGEQGNSYIIGHSSNNANVKSDYNFVFKPIESKSQVGDEFTIFDDQGRELKFRVFESLAVEDDNAGEAYKNFGEKRVVTLQSSIVSTRNGKMAPYQRWLTRAELVL